jgi:hypothetical protein
MQTFLPYQNIRHSAKVLDRHRLGKQRIEAVQIARECLGITKSNWSNHPAVKMWVGYEPFLVKVYLRAIMSEWKRRGYKNTKTEQNYFELLPYIAGKKVIKPHWIDEKFCKSHRSNLVYKKPDYYSQFFSEKSGMEYVWPKKD